MVMEGRPLADNVFTWPSDNPALIGGMDARGRIRFPFMGRPGEKPVELAREGALWSWTVQRFLPKQPPYLGRETKAEFQPFALGYVELSGQVRVETRLVDCAPEDLRIGMPMRLTIRPLFQDEQGQELLMYAFRPVA